MNADVERRLRAVKMKSPPTDFKARLRERLRNDDIAKRGRVISDRFLKWTTTYFATAACFAAAVLLHNAWSTSRMDPKYFADAPAARREVQSILNVSPTSDEVIPVIALNVSLNGGHRRSFVNCVENVNQILGEQQ